MRRKEKTRKIPLLSLCIFLALVTHLAVFIFLHNHSIYIRAKKLYENAFTKQEVPLKLEFASKEEINFKSLELRKLRPPSRSAPYNQKIEVFLKTEILSLPKVKESVNLFSIKKIEIAKSPTIIKPLKDSLEPKREYLDKIISINSSLNYGKFKGQQGSSSLLWESKKFIPDLHTLQIKDKIREKALFIPTLLSLPPLKELSTLSCSEDFDVSLSFYPQKNENLFAITLIPKNKKPFTKIKKNVFFLLDCSNSIQQRRLRISRYAIISSLSALKKEDKFNILAFDNSLYMLSSKNLIPSAQNFFKARDFLRRISLGSFFSHVNYSIPLNKIVTLPDKKDEINIVILFSNGDELERQKNKLFINRWTKKNNGNFSLFAIATNDDQNLELLDFCSEANKGKLVLASYDRNIKKTLTKLIKSIDFPIIKNISATVIPKKENRKIILQTPFKLPNIYFCQPIVIVGTIDKLENFTLFLQGFHGNKFFNIKKELSFDRAEEDPDLHKKTKNLNQSYSLFAKYLISEDLSFLKKAQDISKDDNYRW